MRALLDVAASSGRSKERLFMVARECLKRVTNSQGMKVEV